MSTHIKHRWRKPVLLALFLAALASTSPAFAVSDDDYVLSEDGTDRFALSTNGQPVPLHASADDYAGVLRAARDLQADLGRVTGTEPAFSTEEVPDAETMVLVGTLGKSALIDRLVRTGKLNPAGVAGRWGRF